jgi:drug/metabolite transporter (DMT)-like permease
MTRWRADFLLFLAALIWGGGFVAFKTANESMGPVLFVGLRFLLAALLLLPMAYKEAKNESALKSRLRLGKTDILLAVITGLCLFAGSTLQQVGLVYTTATNAGFLIALYIVFTPLVGWVFSRTPIRPTLFIICIISFTGAWLLATNGRAQQLNTGDVIVIIGALGFASQMAMVSKFLARADRPYFLSFMQFAVTALGASAVGIVSESISLHGLIKAMPAILYGGIMFGAVAFTLQIVAQRYTPAAEAGLIMCLEGVFAAIAGALLLHDRLTAFGLAGCGLMLFGAVMTEMLPFWKAMTRRADA